MNLTHAFLASKRLKQEAFAHLKFSFSFVKTDDDDDDDDDELLCVWFTDERRLALFPPGTIVGYPHHCESPTCRDQVLSLLRT